MTPEADSRGRLPKAQSAPVEAGIAVAEREKALHEHASAAEKDDGEENLGNDERPAHETSIRAHAASPAFL